MLRYPFQNDVGHWVCMSAHLFERAINEELMPHGITFRQCQVLAWLALEGDISQVELAERMNIEPPTLVRVLDRMERDGLLVRTHCVEDRRRKIIKPLPLAQPMWKRIVRCAGRVQSRAEKGLTSKQKDTLRKLLDLVEANLARPKKLEKSSG